MGITPTSNFTAYNNWTVAYGTGQTNADFKFSDSNDKEYAKNLDDMADGWIKHYDSNGDGKITFEEYAEKELEELKTAIASGAINANDPNTKAQISSIMNTLVNTFLRLNVDDENGSQDVITKSEAKNFFYTMDSLNSSIQGSDGKPKPDGVINPSEFMAIADTLGADTVQGNPQREAVFGLLLDNYETRFKTD